MRICLVGHFAAAADNRGDLGTKQVGVQIAARISEVHETVHVEIKDPVSWRQIADFGPQIMHFILGPSLSGLLAARLCALFGRGAKTMLSAPNPNLSSWRVAALLRPDLVLVQSHESEAMFRRMGCETRFLPNGVDVQRFLPASPARKSQLREKYGIAIDRLVILHVGPLIKRRNIECLAGLQNAERQVIVVGRTPADVRVQDTLLEAGCIVLTDYIEHMEELYALSDCYVFPTPPANRGASIETPLSVLEAMSCNLPVVTTRFGALTRGLHEGSGLFFAEGDRDLARNVDRAEHRRLIGTRAKVLPYAWECVAAHIEGLYEEMAQ